MTKDPQNVSGLRGQHGRRELMPDGDLSRRHAMARVLGPVGLMAVGSADVAQASTKSPPVYPSAAAGEAATREGEVFFVGDARNPVAYLRTKAASMELSLLETLVGILSNSPGQGCDLIAQPSVPELLASRAGSRGVGSVWHAGGYTFLEAGEETSKPAVTTAGGVRLNAQPVNGDLSARQLGVVPGEGIDNTTAVNGTFEYCIRHGYRAVLDGRVEVSDTVTFRTNSGRGLDEEAAYPERGELLVTRGSQIMMTADNRPILKLQGRGITTSDINVSYANMQPAANTRAVGVLFRDLSFAEIGHLDARRCNVGFSQDWESGERDFFFDNHIRSLRALRYSRRGVVLHPNREGNTPNIVDSISCIAASTTPGLGKGIVRSDGSRVGWQQGIDYHVWLNGCRGLKIGKINVESAAATQALIFLDQCPVVDIGTIHFEAVGLVAHNATLLKSHLSSARIGGISVYDFDTGVEIGDNEATSLLSVITDGYFDIGIFELAGQHYNGANASRLIVGQTGGHRIGRFMGNSKGSAPHLFENKRGAPTSLYTGRRPQRQPMLVEFNGARVEPFFWARAYGAAATRRAGPLGVAEVHDTCGCYDGAGKFSAPQDGLYLIAAQGRAASGRDATFLLKLGDKVLARWRPSQIQAEKNVSNDLNEKILTYWLNVNDVVSFELEDGEVVIDNNCWFSATLLTN